MANNHKKRCSVSLVIREMRINSQMRYHFTPSKLAIILLTKKVMARIWKNLNLHTWVHVCVLSYQLCPTLATLWTVAHQAPLSMGFSRQEYWSGLPCPPPGDLPDPGIKLGSLALAGGFFTTSATWEALIHGSRDIKWHSCHRKQFRGYST